MYIKNKHKSRITNSAKALIIPLKSVYEIYKKNTEASSEACYKFRSHFLCFSKYGSNLQVKDKINTHDIARKTTIN